ncbi:hypothetical protein L1987_40582 [Smallanthus sonchifolius]|uniref:Uncharacterized protein n=1 Tax=Smallanthus sonchifolius TaxID=185202 RepID=A0ACB9GTB5_9ASTR|nr:hypothetical protein L1987_40582 [Smallanthus sonchifolius]
MKILVRTSSTLCPLSFCLSHLHSRPFFDENSRMQDSKHCRSCRNEEQVEEKEKRESKKENMVYVNLFHILMKMKIVLINKLYALLCQYLLNVRLLAIDFVLVLQHGAHDRWF